MTGVEIEQPHLAAGENRNGIRDAAMILVALPMMVTMLQSTN